MFPSTKNFLAFFALNSKSCSSILGVTLNSFNSRLFCFVNTFYEVECLYQEYCNKIDNCNECGYSSSCEYDWKNDNFTITRK